MNLHLVIALDHLQFNSTSWGATSCRKCSHY